MNNTPTKFNWHAYWAPTPVLFRKVGDAILYTSGSVAVPVALAGDRWIAVALFAVGMIGKLISNFFKADTDSFV